MVEGMSFVGWKIDGKRGLRPFTYKIRGGKRAQLSKQKTSYQKKRESLGKKVITCKGKHTDKEDSVYRSHQTQDDNTHEHFKSSVHLLSSFALVS